MRWEGTGSGSAQTIFILVGVVLVVGNVGVALANMSRFTRASTWAARRGIALIVVTSVPTAVVLYQLLMH